MLWVIKMISFFSKYVLIPFPKIMMAALLAFTLGISFVLNGLFCWYMTTTSYYYNIVHLGLEGYVEQFRGGSKVADIVNLPTFVYDTPETFK